MTSAAALERLITAVGTENAILYEPAELPSPSPTSRVPGGGAGGEVLEFAIAGRTPRVALFPGSVEALGEALAAANAQELAVAPYGGGTQIGIGAPPARLDAVMVTRRLNRVVDYQPDDMTVTVEAGVTVAELQRTLAERGQFLPLDPPLPDQATVGGTVAANASGPWRAGFGAARDWLIGVRVASANGEIVKGGGRVVKNVAGYDLCKLYTGSLGTLGVLAELTFKVMPHPETAAMAAVPVVWDEAETLMAAIMDSDLAPSALELFAASADPTQAFRHPSPNVGGGAGGEGLLLVRFDGPREAVEWQLAELDLMAGRADTHSSPLTPHHWEQVRNWTAGPWEWLAVAGVTSSAVVGLIAAGQQVAAAAGVPLEIAARAATGAVCFGARGPLTPEAARELTERLRAEAAARGGTLVVLQAAPALREGLDPWGPLGPELRLMQAIKAQLDPKGILNPGRFVGGI